MSRTATLLLLCLAAPTTEPAPAPDVAQRQVTQSACGFVLVVPQRWTARTSGSDAGGACDLQLVPPGWQRFRETVAVERHVPEFAIRLRTRPGGAETACDEYGLCRRADAWYLSGYGGADTRVRERIANGCRVFHGTREQRVYDRGGYRGLGVVPDAVVIGKGRVAKFDVDHDLSPDFGGEELFDQLVKSLRCR